MFVTVIQSPPYGWRVSDLRFPDIPETSVILKILYIRVENDLVNDSSINMSTGIRSSSCGAWREARSPEIPGRLGSVRTSLQCGISCSLAVYDTDQGSVQSEGCFFLSRGNTTKF